MVKTQTCLYNIIVKYVAITHAVIKKYIPSEFKKTYHRRSLDLQY